MPSINPSLGPMALPNPNPQPSVATRTEAPAVSTTGNPFSADVFETSAASGVNGVNRVSAVEPKTPKVDEAAPVERPSPGLWYTAKKHFWAAVVYLAFKAAKIAPIKKPENEKLEIVRFNELEPSIGIDSIYVTKDVPAAEKSKAKEMLYAAIRWLSSAVPIHTDDMPPIPSDHQQLMDEAYPGLFSKLIDAPKVPAEISARPDDVVGTMALAGPFAAYVEKVEGTDNQYKMDLSKYEKFPVREGLAPLGGTVFFEYSPSEQRMNTTHINVGGKDIIKDSPEWEMAQRVALCTLSTDMTMIRHLANTHMLVAGTFAGVTTNTLDADHPIRRLIHPHCHQTLSTNNYKVANLIKSDESVFPKIFSYKKEQIHQLMNEHAKSFDISSMDPRMDAKARGMSDTNVAYPYQKNATELWDVIHNYTTSYVNSYYDSDEAIAADPQIQAWYNDLNQYVPGGVSDYAGGVTREGVAKLISALIQTASVEHENVGNITWNYTTLHQHIPSIVPADGSLPPLDVYQRYINTSILTFIPLNLLTDDMSHLALDAKGVACMEQFQAEMAELQKKMESEGEHAYSLYPNVLECSVST